jgi:uncharacterized protein (DUF952 family)
MLFHVADRTRWEASVAAGQYTQSTRGMELADVGFIHLSTESQVPGVLERFYAGVTDLVLLHIDETRLTSAVVFEDVPGASEQFPHLYGPLNPDAVTGTSSVT